MIRANLLPQPRQRVGFAGFEVDVDTLRQAFFGLAIVGLVTIVGVAVESLRVARLETFAAQQDREIAAQAMMRADVKAVALDVARYQNFAREARLVRESGAEAARTIARIGNGVPDGVWLTSLERQDSGYEIVGAAKTLDRLGAAMISLGDAWQQARATLVTIDNRSGVDGVRFTARLAANAPSQRRISDSEVSP